MSARYPVLLSILCLAVLLVVVALRSWVTRTPAPAQQSIVQPQSEAAGVVGSMWAGTDSDGDYYKYYFQPGGVLHYQSPSGFYKDGSWTQDGNTIYMEMNKKYSEHKGTIKGLRMEGEAWNVQGHRWTWVAEKQ